MPTWLVSDVMESMTENPQQVDVNSTATVVSVVLGSAVALLALYLGPVLIGEYIRALGVSDARAGMLLSTELFGFTLGAASLFVLPALSWRKVVAIALALMVAGNMMLLVVTQFHLFTACRFVAGLGSGLLMTMTIQVIALMNEPDRIYGLWTTGQLSLGALGMVIFPRLVELGGINAVFVTWAILALLLGASIRFYPSSRGEGGHENKPGTAAGNVVLGVFCLLGLFVYYSGQAGVWAYLERIGASWDIDLPLVFDALFYSLISGIGGAAIAIFLGARLGHTIPITISLVISAIAIAMLITLQGVVLFTVAACLFNFAWYLFLPYISGTVAGIDQSGRLLTGLSVIFPGSLAVGPAVGALFISNDGSVMPALLIGLFSVPVGLFLILPATRALVRTQ